MTNKPVVAPTVTFVDNLHAPDVFADSVTGVFLFNGNLRITFESFRSSYVADPAPISRVVIGRLVIPLDAAKNMRDLLVDFLGKQTTDPMPQVQAKPTLQ
jgi:hypothetical protein